MSTDPDDGRERRGNGGSTDESRDESGDQSDGGGRGENGSTGRRDESSTLEKAVIAVSVAFTLLLFAYAGWQMVTQPGETTPRATVVGTETLENGSVAVTVSLENSGEVGLISATVASDCASPPAAVEFSFVPASSDRTGTLVCPPGTTDPSVSMANWVSR